jgi:hypothetical protein
MVEKLMVEFLDKMKALVVETKAKLKEPVTATRSKVILVGLAIVLLFVIVA